MTSLSRKLLPSTSALAAFDSVARLGSFSLAADELSLTQGAISRQVMSLEEQLGVRLFERGARGVSLTRDGETYAKAIGIALGDIRSASLQVMTKTHANTLNLAMLPTFGTRWLLPRIPKFVAAHPEITLNFATRIGQFDFEKEGLDMAIHIGQPDWPAAESVFLMDEMVAPVCSPAFLASHPIGKADDIAGLALLHMASRPGAWDHWFKSVGIVAHQTPAMRFEQFSSVAQACIAGLGVALMPLFLIESELKSGQLVQAFDHPVKSPAPIMPSLRCRASTTVPSSSSGAGCSVKVKRFARRQLASSRSVCRVSRSSRRLWREFHPASILSLRRPGIWS